MICGISIDELKVVRWNCRFIYKSVAFFFVSPRRDLDFWAICATSFNTTSQFCHGVSITFQQALHNATFTRKARWHGWSKVGAPSFSIKVAQGCLAVRQDFIGLRDGNKVALRDERRHTREFLIYASRSRWVCAITEGSRSHRSTAQASIPNALASTPLGAIFRFNLKTTSIGDLEIFVNRRITIGSRCSPKGKFNRLKKRTDIRIRMWNLFASFIEFESMSYSS